MNTPPPQSAPPAADWRARLAALSERRWFRWGRDLALVALVLLAVGAWQTRGHLPSGARPAAQLTTLEGAPATLESLRGKPVLLAFWAPWCTVCGAEAGNVSWARDLLGERATVISVATAYGEVAEVRAFMAEHGVDVPVWLGDEQALRDFRLDVFPTAYFLDAEGRVKGSVSGYTTTLGLVARTLW